MHDVILLFVRVHYFVSISQQSNCWIYTYNVMCNLGGKVSSHIIHMANSLKSPELVEIYKVESSFGNVKKEMETKKT